VSDTPATQRPDDDLGLFHYLVRSSRREHQVLAGLPVEESIESLQACAAQVSNKSQVIREIEQLDRLSGLERERASRRLLARSSALMSIQVGTLVEKVDTWRASATVTFRGQQHPYHAAPSMLAELPTSADRQELSAAYWRVTDEIADDLARIWVERQKIVVDLGYENYAAAFSHWKALDLPQIEHMARATITETERTYRNDLDWFLDAHANTSRNGFHHCDLPRLFRGQQWDYAFHAEALVTTTLATARGLGVDVTALPGVKLDLDDRHGKTRRPFCVAVTAPGEIHLVAVPSGGQRGYEEVLHEFGHVAHFALTDEALPWDLRLLPDDTVAESVAYLFAELLYSPEFLTRRMGMAEQQAMDFARYARFLECTMVRRYCAKVLFEVEAHTSGDLAASAPRYAWWLESVTGMEVPQQSVLTETDTGLYAVQYLLAWFLAAQIRERLHADFGPNWFDNPSARPSLRRIWSQACRHTPATLLAETTGATSLDWHPLCDDLATTRTADRPKYPPDEIRRASE